MKLIVAIVLFLLTGLSAFAQQDDKPQYIDGVKTPRWGSTVRADEISYVENKPDGFYIYTKVGIRKHYWNFLRKKSAAYAHIATNPLDDSNIQYILNGSPLYSGYEKVLFRINNKNYAGLNIIDRRSLEQLYGVYGKDYGVMIKTKH